MRVLPVPLAVGRGVEPEVGAEVDDLDAVVEQLLGDRRRLAVRRAEEGDVHAAELRLAAEREVAAQARQVLLHRLAGERLGADRGELDRGVPEQQLGQERAGVAAAADDAGAGDAGVAAGAGGWTVGRSVVVVGLAAGRRCHQALRVHVGGRGQGGWSPAEGVSGLRERLAGLEQTETPTGRRASCTSGSEGGAAGRTPAWRGRRACSRDDVPARVLMRAADYTSCAAADMRTLTCRRRMRDSCEATGSTVSGGTDIRHASELAEPCVRPARQVRRTATSRRALGLTRDVRRPASRLAASRQESERLRPSCRIARRVDQTHRRTRGCEPAAERLPAAIRAGEARRRRPDRPPRR